MKNLPIAGITASLPLRFGVEISIVYTVATVVETPRPLPNNQNSIIEIPKNDAID